jgi:hypothetical protein
MVHWCNYNGGQLKGAVASLANCFCQIKYSS